MGSPIIKTWDEWINKLNDQESSETETDIDTTNTTSDSDYKDEGGMMKTKLKLTVQKKFQPKEDQIIRQKSLESGKEPLKPSINSELLSPHSNYLVDSDQMILLLNNVRCPCGRKKLLVDIKEGYGSFKAVLLCPNCPLKQWESNQEEFYFSKKIEQKSKQKKRIKLNLKQKSGSER
ncbi:hypothetical protein M0813_03452 [Anaeramoeba flamelloides]|uniref:Uncharacterized protein n=1 Tax=Anaeramoeba flamelloides TaxID=1746091 RepID=A0ABQ8XXH9_9EUKA|nr:hypothetical protein M0813_03452 [Anaeramoeba flamelloides]